MCQRARNKTVSLVTPHSSDDSLTLSQIRRFGVARRCAGWWFRGIARRECVCVHAELGKVEPADCRGEVVRGSGYGGLVDLKEQMADRRAHEPTPHVALHLPPHRLRVLHGVDVAAAARRHSIIEHRENEMLQRAGKGVRPPEGRHVRGERELCGAVGRMQGAEPEQARKRGSRRSRHHWIVCI